MARILVVDDEEIARYTVRAILESADHEVFEADNGETGLTSAREGNYDLVITDIVMPQREGVSLIVELRRTHPDLKIIAVSGGGRMKGDGYLNMASELGANATLSKPFEKDELLTLVNQCLAAP